MKEHCKETYGNAKSTSLLGLNLPTLFLTLLFVLASVSVSSAIFVHEYAGEEGFPTINIIGFENGTYNSTVALNITFNVTDTDWDLSNVSLLFYNSTWNVTNVNTTNTSVVNDTMTVIAVSDEILPDGTYYWGLNATRGGDGNTTYSGIYTYYVDTTDTSSAYQNITDYFLIAGENTTWVLNLTERNYNASTTKAYIVNASSQLTAWLNDTDSSLDISVSDLVGTDHQIMNVTWTVGSDIAEGNYSFMLNLTDKAGNSAGFFNYTTVFVNTAPVFDAEEVNDTHIQTGQLVEWYFNITDYQFNATNNTAGSIIDADGALVMSLNLSSTDSGDIYCGSDDDRIVYKCNVTWNATAEGVYFLNMTSTDLTGLTSTLRTSAIGPNVTVDDTAPTTVTLVAANFSTTTNYTGVNETVTINITFSDASLNTSNVDVYIVNASETEQYANATTLGTDQIVLSTEGDNVIVTWNSTAHDNSALLDGTYYLRVNLTDYAGNSAGELLSGIGIIADNTNPAFSEETQNATLVQRGDVVVWTFNLTEANYPTIQNHAYIVSTADETVQYVNDTSSDLSYTFATTTGNDLVTVEWTVGDNVMEGNYSFSFNTTDAAGNAAGRTNLTTVFVDTGPSYSLWEINDTHIQTGQGAMWSFNLTDYSFNSTNTVGQIIDSDGALVKTITSGNVSCATNDDARKTYACNVTWNATAEGVYFLNMTSTDLNGSTGFSRYNLTGVNITVDDTVPSTFTLVSAEFGLETNYTKTNSTITFNFTMTDASYNLSNVQIYIMNASQPNQSFSNYTDVSADQIAVTEIGNMISAIWNSTNSDNTALTDGNYTVIVNATDLAGNSGGEVLGGILITVDNTFPAFSSIPAIDDGTLARTTVTTQTLYVNTTFVETNRYNVSFEIYNTSLAYTMLVNSTLMSSSNVSLTRYRSAGFDGIYMPIGNWTVRVNVTDKAGNVASNATTIVSDIALRVTLSGTASGSGTAGGSTPVRVATFNVIAKGYPNLAGYLHLVGPGAESYVNDYNGDKQAFISNISAMPTATGNKFQLAGNSTYGSPSYATTELPAVTPATLSGTIYNDVPSTLSVYIDTIYMYITPYVSTTGSWAGTYGFGVFNSSS